MSSDPATERRIIKTPRAPKLPSSIYAFFFSPFLPLARRFSLLPPPRKRDSHANTLTFRDNKRYKTTKMHIGTMPGFYQRDLPMTGPLGKIYRSGSTHRSHWLCAICLFFICRIFLFFSFFLRIMNDSCFYLITPRQSASTAS